MEEAIESWLQELMGGTLGTSVAAGAIFILFLCGRKIIARLIISWLQRLNRRIESKVLGEILLVSAPPLRLAVVLVGLYAAGQVAPFSDQTVQDIEKLDRSLAIFTLFWALYLAIKPLLSLLNKRIAMGPATMQETLSDFLSTVARVVLVFVGTAMILHEWGFQVVALLGSLGLVGAAVGLAARDFVMNLISGLVIFFEGTFEKGNWIRTPEIQGTVEDIGFRSSRIRCFDKSLVTVPNSKLTDEALINFSRMTHRRIYWTIGLEYRTSQEQLRDIVQDISEYIHIDDDFETDPTKTSTFVFVDTFADSSINIMLYCFTKTTDWGKWLGIKEALAYRVKQIVEGYDAGFAFPSSSIYVEAMPMGKPEPFLVPGQGQAGPS